MPMRPAVPAFLMLALLISPVFAADDQPAPGLRAFCENLLNAHPNASLNGTAYGQNATPIALPQNITLGARHNESLAMLMGANASVKRMRGANLPYLRANDLLEIAWQWFDGQTAIELSGGMPEYGFTLQKVSEITALEQDSLSISDDLKTLSSRLEGVDAGVNVSGTKALMSEAAQEFQDGRLAEAKAALNSAYNEISRAESQAVHSQTMVESARRNIENFLEDNWKAIVASVCAMLALLFIFQKQIRRFFINARLKSLLREREVVSSMQKSLQQDYFQRKSITELTFRVKTKKYGDIVRNINRQIPLLKEELKRI